MKKGKEEKLARQRGNGTRWPGHRSTFCCNLFCLKKNPKSLPNPPSYSPYPEPPPPSPPSLSSDRATLSFDARIYTYSVLCVAQAEPLHSKPANNVDI